MTLTQQKLAQAAGLVAKTGVDLWLVFVRETSESGDPVLPLILEGSLTWQSALIVTNDGRKVAIVGSLDAGPLEQSGDWDEVVTYVQGIGQPLRETLDRLIPTSVEKPKIAVNYSINDVKADGLTHGMYLQLVEYFAGTRYEGSLISAEDIVMPLRGIKSPAEVERMIAAIDETDRLFGIVHNTVKPGMTERDVYNLIHSEARERGLGMSWDPTMCPIVNTGPNSMVGHGTPSDTLKIEPGHILHIDLGVTKDGYSSDIQSCWYVLKTGETQVPGDVAHATAAVVGAITAGAEALKPGVAGWEVDAAARGYLVSQGYPEYQHAFGHQVGRVAHDGGKILGPQWERYGNTPNMPIETGEVYTLELGVDVPGKGIVSLEEMAQVTDDGLVWLTKRQMVMEILS